MARGIAKANYPNRQCEKNGKYAYGEYRKGCRCAECRLSKKERKDAEPSYKSYPGYARRKTEARRKKANAQLQRLSRCVCQKRLMAANKALKRVVLGESLACNSCYQQCKAPWHKWWVKGCSCPRCRGLRLKRSRSPRRKALRNAAAKRRRRSDPDYRVKDCLRSSFYRWIKGRTKEASVMHLVGCNLEELWNWLLEHPNNQGQWTRENYGTVWHIDHAIPLAMFTAEQQAEAWHYTNLRPMDAMENMRKRDSYASIQC